MAEQKQIGIVSIEPRGAYSATERYTKLDAARYSGKTYLAVRDSTGIIPGESPNWQYYWMMIVQDGLNEWGVSGQVIITPQDWSGNAYTFSPEGLEANDAIFFTPASRADAEILSISSPFVTSSGVNVTFSVVQPPLASVSLNYFISKGYSE